MIPHYEVIFQRQGHRSCSFSNILFISILITHSAWFYVQEADAAVSIMGEMDAWIICPFFLEGGRYTIADIHYVADSDRYDLLVFLII